MPTNGPPTQPLLNVKDLSKQYKRGGIWSKRFSVDALTSVNFEIFPGKTFALVGRSGSGKSTVARCVAGLEKPDKGHVWINGADLASLRLRDLFAFRPEIQMVFQDAITAMNPRFSAEEVVGEPLQIRGQSRDETRDLVHSLMKEVGLSADWMTRSILHFSGGQQQRLAIARALILRPKLLVLDEALSGLDLSTQSQVANLLLDLQESHSLTYLLISHDLALVARLADSVAVIDRGGIVENGPAREIVGTPKHAETKRLLTSARAAEASLASLTGEPA